MIGLFNEVGPCYVTPANTESLTTTPRKYGWDGLSNMLFIDQVCASLRNYSRHYYNIWQPNQVGLSFDTPTNGSLSLFNYRHRPELGVPAPPIELQPNGETDFDIPDDDENFNGYFAALNTINVINGTFPSGKTAATANTTQIAAQSAWHFLQGWLTSFPQYSPKSGGLNLIAESYGGKYGPSFFEFFEKQNERKKAGEIPKETLEIHLGALGIVNGCIDALGMTPSYAEYAYENPYGIEALNETSRNSMLDNFEAPDGCREKVQTCRRLLDLKDPFGHGDNEEVNTACQVANKLCDLIRGLYRTAKRQVSGFMILVEY